MTENIKNTLFVNIQYEVVKIIFLRITHESLYRGVIFRNHDNRKEELKRKAV
jgi:hypothetical protein